MKICFLSYSNTGGAGKATVRIIKSLKKLDIKCDHKFVIKDGKLPFKDRIKEKINRHSSKLEKNKKNSFKSLSIFPSSLWKDLNKSDYDIIHLTWINEILSIEDIGKIKKPIVWTLADMWPFTGLNHYDDYSKKAFWRKKNYLKIKKPFFDIDYWLLNRKIKSWKNMDIICPSNWILECAKNSMVMSDFRHHLIPWPVDMTFYKKLNKNKLRRFFNLPLKKKLIIFNAFNGIKDSRKGWKYLIKAVEITKEEYDIVIIGEDRDLYIKNNTKKNFFSVGKFKDELGVSKILNCGDLLVIPSMMDNLPQVGIEAQACGLPVVTFDCNGLKDLVNHKKNGYLAKAYEYKSLAKGIDWTIRNLEKKNLSRNAIKIVKSNWDSKVVSAQYKALYDKILRTNVIKKSVL